MSLFSALFESWHALSAPPVAPHARKGRAAERFELSQPVSIGRPAAVEVTGCVINISVIGAAIRIDEWNSSRSEWLAGLNQGDELRIKGLLSAPVSCWVVVSDEELLRVHFSGEDAQRRVIGETISRLAAAHVSTHRRVERP